MFLASVIIFAYLVDLKVMTINCVTRTPGAKYFVTLLKRKIEKCIETDNVLAARVELLQVSGVAVESKRCCGF